MADIVTAWNTFIITDNGLNLRQRAIATGETIAFNYAKIGQGVPADAGDIPIMEDLVLPAEEVAVIRSESNNVTHYVGIRIDNISFQEPILMREIGLFASIDDETPILYGYTYATQGYDSIPAGSVAHYVWTVGIDTVISRAQNISFTYDASAIYATQEDIDQLIQAFEAFKTHMESVGNVIFSPERPEGEWTLWLQDFGEITDFSNDEMSLLLETAPLDAPGEFAVMDETGGETVLNMTDNKETAKQDDIIISEQ